MGPEVYFGLQSLALKNYTEDLIFQRSLSAKTHLYNFGHMLE